MHLSSFCSTKAWVHAQLAQHVKPCDAHLAAIVDHVALFLDERVFVRGAAQLAQHVKPCDAHLKPCDAHLEHSKSPSCEAFFRPRQRRDTLGSTAMMPFNIPMVRPLSPHCLVRC